MNYGDVKIAAEALDRILYQRGMNRENYSLGVGAGIVHVYAKCAKSEWGCVRPSQVEGVNIEWHWDIGPITAFSRG